MTYFVKEPERKASHSSYYFEFQKGQYRDVHWKADSVSIHADVWDELALSALFLSAAPNFDDCGLTPINAAQWEALVRHAEEQGTPWEDIIHELTPWVKSCPGDDGILFTVLGL